MAVFGATGMTTGFAVGGLIGTSAGAVNSVAKEIETRNLKREQEVGKALEVSMPSPALEKPEQNNDRYFNFKVGALFSGLGAIAGAVLAAGFFAPSIVAGSVVAATSSIAPALDVVLGSALASNTAAVTAYSVGVMSMFGALFGVNFPKITTEAQDFAGRLLSGELLGTDWKKSPESGKQLQNDNIIAVKSQTKERSTTDSICKAECTTNHVARLGRGNVSVDSYKDLIKKGKEVATEAAGSYIGI